jgi:hypothetical protein
MPPAYSVAFTTYAARSNAAVWRECILRRRTTAEEGHATRGLLRKSKKNNGRSIGKLEFVTPVIIGITSEQNFYPMTVSFIIHQDFHCNKGSPHILYNLRG